VSWDVLEDMLNRAVVTSGTGQTASYTPVPASQIAGVPCTFDLDSYDVDLDGVRIATGVPEIGVRHADLPRAPLKGDLVTVGGVNYVVNEVRLSGQVGFSKCRLRLAA
jgi:hypothetical protein